MLVGILALQGNFNKHANILNLLEIENNYVKPRIIPIEDIDSKLTRVKDGRNPIVEQLLDENKFIPNDIDFNENQNLIILGLT